MPEPNRFLQGSFAPVEEEITAFGLPVTGSLPAGLNGRYLRNGPNPLGLDDPDYRFWEGYWFLGPGMVHGVRLRDGKAEWYRNRWVRSQALAEAMDEKWPGGPVHADMDFAANTRCVDPLFEGIKIVDCDTHFTEPADLWTSHAPAGMKDKMPHVRRINGADQWFVGDKHFGSIGGNVIAKDHNKLLGRLAFQNYDQINPGSYDVKERLKDMDAMGVWAQICFQNGGLTQAGSCTG